MFRKPGSWSSMKVSEDLWKSKDDVSLIEKDLMLLPSSPVDCAISV